MEKFPKDEYKSENMDLKTVVLNKYFKLIQIVEHPELIEKWGKENAEAYDKLAAAESEFLERFEEKLDQYR